MKSTMIAPSMPGIRKVMDRMLEPFFAPLSFPEAPMLETEWAPRMDFSETEKEYLVRLEVPGIHKENLDISLEGNVLTLSGHRENRKEREEENFLWTEREEGRFLRSLRLPKAVKGNEITATHQDGVLVVRLPKTELAVKSRITIK